MWPNSHQPPWPNLLAFSSHPTQTLCGLVVFQHTQSVLASGPLHMLFSPTRSVFLLQLLLAQSHTCAQLLLSPSGPDSSAASPRKSS